MLLVALLLSLCCWSGAPTSALMSEGALAEQRCKLRPEDPLTRRGADRGAKLGNGEAGDVGLGPAAAGPWQPVGGVSFRRGPLKTVKPWTKREPCLRESPEAGAWEVL